MQNAYACVGEFLRESWWKTYVGATLTRLQFNLVARNMERLTQYVKKVWDTIGNEYYSEVHKTSRNFDTIIHNRLPRIISKLHSNGLYLDLGGGRGRLKEIYTDISFNIVVGDISLAMMKTGTDIATSTCYIQMDAFRIPFNENTFDGVFSLLGDPYSLPDVFEEVLRILKPDGFFFLALPTKIWAENLRPILGVEINQFVFRIRDGRLMKSPSFVYDSKNLQKILLSIGFRQVKTGEWRSLNLISKDQFSRDVLIAAKNLDMPPEYLPLITYALAYKIA